MITADQLTNAIDPSSGRVRFSLNLLARSEPRATDLRLSLSYDSEVWKNASTWNVRAPTGVVGLGWKLERAEIVWVPRFTAAAEGSEWLLDMGDLQTPLVRTGSDGSKWLFSMVNYQFWKITYDPGRERWEIVLEDGSRRVFGDVASGRSTVQWGVAWDNWLGSSSQVANQSRVATRWSLSQIVDLWNNSTTYTYETDDLLVGPAGDSDGGRPRFTRSSRLIRIDATSGESARLSYRPKEAAEVGEPHTHPSPPNAYQDRVETSYLDTVELFGADGERLFTEALQYDDGAGEATFLGTGDLTKRLLTGVRRTWANGRSLPGVRFSYYTANDGVSATQLYDSSRRALYGALKSVTLPEGGQVTYGYGEQLVGLSERSTTVAPPNQGGTAYSRPRVAIATDEVAVAWYGNVSNQSSVLQLTAWRWSGRWLQATLDAIPISNASAYDRTPMLVQHGYIAVVSGQRVYLYYRDPDRPDTWVCAQRGGDRWFSTTLLVGEPVSLVGGDHFVVVLGLHSGKLYRYRWTGSEWTDDGVQALGAGGAKRFAAAAKLDVLITAAGQPGVGAPVSLRVQRLDTLGAWTQEDFTITSKSSGRSTLSLSLGLGLATLEEEDTLGEGTIIQARALWWDRAYTRMSEADLGRRSAPPGQTPPRAVLRGAMVSIGQQAYRFDGRRWLARDLSDVGALPGATLIETWEGFDQVLRVVQAPGGAIATDLVAFDPYTATWSVPAGMSRSALSPAVATRAARTDDTASDVVLLNGVVYRQQPDASWTPVLTLPDTLTGDDLASLQLLDERYVIYQAGADTKVFALHNGGVAPGAPIVRSGEKISISAADSSLVGRRIFATYTGTYGAADSRITLYRVSNRQITSHHVGYGVVRITKNTGYQQIVTSLSYKGDNATIDMTGTRPAFNQVTVVQGSSDPAIHPYGATLLYFYNGLGASEAPERPPAPGSNAASYASRVVGTLYATRVLRDDGMEAALTEDTWTVTPVVLAGTARGHYLRLTQHAPTLDGVGGLVRMTYSPDTGLVTETSRDNYDSAGVHQRLVERFEYFWERYDPTKSTHLLSPVIRTVSSTLAVAANTETVTGTEVQTWKQDWGQGTGTWAPWQTFSARNGGATFTHWFGGGEADPDWLHESTVLARNEIGNVTSLLDASGATTTQLWGRNGYWPTGGAANADASELDYLGFEPYEALDAWAWTDPYSSLSAHVTDSDHHTGTRCLELPARPGVRVGPLRVFLPTNQTRRYVFSAWGKTPIGFDSQRGAARWQISAYRSDDDSAVGTPMMLDITETNGAWSRVQQLIDLPGLRDAAAVPDAVSIYVVIRAWNQNDSFPARIDNLRVSPVDGVFAAMVLDPGAGQITATLGNNLETNRFVYDQASRCVAHVGPQDRVKHLATQSLSRELSLEDRFLPTFPNGKLLLRTTSDSIYYDFHNGRSDNWVFGEGAWSIAEGALRYAPTSPPAPGPLGSTATLRLFAFTNFAIRVVCTIAPGGSAGVGNGEMFAYWDGGHDEWILARKAANGTLSTVARNAELGFGADWVFSIVEGFLTFAVDGVSVFSYSYVANNSVAEVGKPVLALLQSGSFDDLLVLNDPQVEIGFFDGVGCHLQSLRYEGRAENATTIPTQATGVLLDALGRPAVDRNPLRPALRLTRLRATADGASLIEGAPSAYLVDPENNPLSVPEYLAGQGGVYDYTVRRYEHSPLGRLVATVLPRETNTTEASFTTTNQYLATGETGPAAVFNDLLPAGSSGRYFVNCSTDPNGVQQYALLDQQGRLLARRTRLDEGRYQTMSWERDAAGRIVTYNPPNVFSPPDGSVAAAWRQTQTYDFLGRPTSQATPSEGVTRTLYDDAGRLRFQMSAEDAAQAPQRIRYAKYDGRGRIVEQGYFQDAAYAWSAPALLAKLEDQSFPNVEDSGDLDYAHGQWSHRTEFDWDRIAPSTTDLLGRAVRKRTWNPSPGVHTETFAYDINGNVSKHTSQLANLDPNPWVTTYKYNNLEQLAAIEYPRHQGEPTTEVGYYFDRLGKIVSVGDTLSGGEVIDPSNPADAGEQLYAAYTYDARGAVSALALNNGRGMPPGTVNPARVTRTYSYTPQGWIAAIADPYLTETVDYYGDPNHAYHDGSIASVAFRYAPERWKGAPADESTTFHYDPLYRLLDAKDGLNAAWSLSIGTDGYDANGNLRTMTRGATTTTYHYSSDGQAPTSDRVDHLSNEASSSMSFDGLTSSPSSADGWCWGADNHGPSSSGIVLDVERGDVLSLAGGSFRHTESLRLTTWLAPAGSYTLTYHLRTELGGALGRAAWMVRIHTAEGEIVTSTIAVLADTGGAWASFSHNIDLATILRTLGLGEDPSYVTLECVNGLRASYGAGPGPTVRLDDITLATAATIDSPAYGYDDNGNITAAPSRALSSLSYDPLTGLTRDVSFAAGGTVRYTYDSNRRCCLAERRSSTGTTQHSIRRLMDQHGKLLMTIATSSQSAPVVTRYVRGIDGTVAVIRDGDARYLLKDHLGSTRALVDGTSGEVLDGATYLPFGKTARSFGRLERLPGYTGQLLDADTGLYDYQERFYDPDLQRFYSPDPMAEYATPYSYVGNNPINRTDPNGALSQELAKKTASIRTLVDDFDVTSKLFFEGRDGLLDEYYTEALPDVWRQIYRKKVSIAFGRDDNNRLRDFTRTLSGRSGGCEDVPIKYYACFPGYTPSFETHRHLFLKFLFAAMNASAKIYVNLDGLLEKEVIDIAFQNPAAITNLWIPEYSTNALNETSLSYLRKVLPELMARDVKEPHWLLRFLFSSVLVEGSLSKKLYTPGHSAWEISTINSIEAYRSKTTFVKNGKHYSYQEYASRYQSVTRDKSDL